MGNLVQTMQFLEGLTSSTLRKIKEEIKRDGSKDFVNLNRYLWYVDTITLILESRRLPEKMEARELGQ
jgi:hypothetical protein